MAAGTTGTPIAVIGMAGRFPGADDLTALWDVVAAGEDRIGPVPADRPDLLADPRMRGVRAGFLDRVAEFDATAFGISPREAGFMDPQQRHFLEVTWEALQDAGRRPGELAGTATGVFVGVATGDYNELMASRGGASEAHMATGVAHAVLANRVSHLLDLRGPSEALDTACSSSLVAVHHAVRALRDGDCDLAVAGGVNLTLSPALYDTFTRAGMLSAQGRCASFDDSADGYVRGEGVGAVVLKPLHRALEDGDPVRAVILGSAVNHGGRSPSLTARTRSPRRRSSSTRCARRASTPAPSATCRRTAPAPPWATRSRSRASSRRTPGSTRTGTCPPPPHRTSRSGP
ncbi:hypothetical protein DD630_30720 [Streptomyces sp. BSE7F]|nr:hypothetical protein DD630_30720 [Streptomyces sp. BSE7F]